MESKSIKDRQTFNHNQQKNRPKFDPGGSGGHFGLPRSVLGPMWTAVGAPPGGHVGAMLAQKLVLGGPGWLSKATMKFDTFSNRFGNDFGSILGSKMEPKSVQDWSQERS